MFSARSGMMLAPLLLAACGSGGGGNAVTPGAAMPPPMPLHPTGLLAGSGPEGMIASVSPVGYEGGSATVGVLVEPGLTAVQALYPPGHAVPLVERDGAWYGVIEVPGNGDSAGMARRSAIPLTARDGRGQVVTGSVDLVVLAAEPPPAP